MRRLILLTLLLSGCSTQNYFNHAVSFRYQPEQYNYDLAFLSENMQVQSQTLQYHQSKIEHNYDC